MTNHATTGVWGEIWERARRAYPQLDVGREGFEAFLTERALGRGTDDASLRRVCVEDLLLVYACLQGLSEAQALMVELVREAARVALRRREALAPLQDEVCARLLEGLFAGIGGRAAKLHQYRGQGSLKRWLRMAAVRLALNAKGTRTWEEPLDEAILARFTKEPTQEKECLSHRCAPLVMTALHEALAALSPRDRNLLRYRFLDGLALEAICTLYGVHRSTLTRWMGELRLRLREHVHRRLAEQMKLDSGEAESVIRALLSQLDTSICARLET